MPGDYTRSTFDALRDHIGVFMQQGRVMLDADFNEFVEIVERRIRAGDLDTLGPCVVPRETPEGFRIQIAGSSLTIGPGRIYVDGILAENHGAAPMEFYRRLEEERGTAAVDYHDQPYLKDAESFFPIIPRGGPHLVYVDVWQRELTHVEVPALMEKAVAVDTATRLQTVWQVKVLNDVGEGVTCASADEDIDGWLDLTAPSAGRLTTSAVGVPADTDPCVVSPTGGFRGTENRLYRVEVHDPGPMGTATFKWSRDNGSIASVVTAINAAGDQLTVSRTARDQVLRFSANDWVEVLDDRLELAGQPGVMRKVATVDDVAGTITLDAALAATDVDFVDPRELNTRVRKWDQSGQVLDDANAVVADVDASGGVIPIGGAARFVLENGVLTEFDLDPAGGQFRTGDYWIFAARTADASVEELSAAPPRGIHHHYCKLAVVTFPDVVSDCRVFWPPEFGGSGCACTECVSAESHNSGAFTIQMAIDRVVESGGTVCLGPGTYNLGSTPIRISGAQSVTLVGQGLRTLLVYVAREGDEAAIQVNGSMGVEIDSLAVLSAGIEAGGGPALLVRNSGLVQAHHCGFLYFGGRAVRGSAVVLEGVVLQTTFHDNLIFGRRGIDALARTTFNEKATAALAATRLGFVATLGVHIRDNLIFGVDRGVSLDGLIHHLGDLGVDGNTIWSGPHGGVVTTGFVLPASRIDVEGNELITSGHGVIVGSANTRVTDNDISSFEDDIRPGSHIAGVVMAQLALPLDIDRCRITGNRIVGIPGDGIGILTAVGSAVIRDNWIEAVAGNGITMAGEAKAELLSIDGNHIVDASTANDPDLAVAAIRVARADQVAISGNVVRGFAKQGVQNAFRVGIEVNASGSVRIDGNDLSSVGPDQPFLGFGAGISVLSPFDRLDIMDNSVRRVAGAGADADDSKWFALLVSAPLVVADNMGTFMMAATKSGTTAGGATLVRETAFGDNLSVRTKAVFTINRDLKLVTDNFVVVTDFDVFELPRGQQILAVRGNLLEASGSVSTADIRSQGAVVFSENRCLLAPAPNTSNAIVDIDATAAIASGNYVERPKQDGGPPAFDIDIGNGPFTVLGNISTGAVLLNGAALGAPWAALNVQV